MPKVVTFNPEAFKELMKGVDTICNATKVTLGPKGRNVLITLYCKHTTTNNISTTHVPTSPIYIRSTKITNNLPFISTPQ